MLRTVLAAFFAAFLLGAPAHAVPSAPAGPIEAIEGLSEAQRASLQAFLEKTAQNAPAGKALTWSEGAARATISYDIAPPSLRGAGSSACRVAYIAFTDPPLGAYDAEICMTTNWEYRTLAVLTRVTPVNIDEEMDVVVQQPPPPAPPPVVEPPDLATAAPVKPAQPSEPKKATSAAPSRDRGPTAAIVTDDMMGDAGPVAREAPASAANPTAGSGGVGGGVVRTLTAVVVELGPVEPRYARHGGSAVVLLSENGADEAKNLALCKSLFRAFDQASVEEVIEGERTTDEGDIEELRPLYWLLKDKTPIANGADKCQHRVAKYDFARAWKIRSKMSLTGRGPYLLISRADERRAGLVDLSTTPTRDVDDMVRYFAEGFSQEDDVWAVETYEPSAAQIAINEFFGRAMQVAALPRLVTMNAARAGCPLGNLFDLCTNPAPR